MFELKKTVGRNYQADLDDTAKTKFAMTSLEYYDDTETGLAPYADDQLFKSVRAFQKDNDLKVDGVMKPEGETQNKIKEKLYNSSQTLGAYKDFVKNYFDLKRSNTIGSDKYFHCKANYEATKRGKNGEKAAKTMSDKKESLDKFRKKHLKIEQFSDLDSFRDQKANIWGREAAKTDKFSSSNEACAIFRPEGLDEKY